MDILDLNFSSGRGKGAWVDGDPAVCVAHAGGPHTAATLRNETSGRTILKPHEVDGAPCPGGSRPPSADHTVCPVCRQIAPATTGEDGTRILGHTAGAGCPCADGPGLWRDGRNVEPAPPAAALPAKRPDITGMLQALGVLPQEIEASYHQMREQDWQALAARLTAEQRAEVSATIEASIAFQTAQGRSTRKRREAQRAWQAACDEVARDSITITGQGPVDAVEIPLLRKPPIAMVEPIEEGEPVQADPTPEALAAQDAAQDESYHLSRVEEARALAARLGWGLDVIHDLGKRGQQQDRWAVAEVRGALLLVVCDGLGGHVDGAGAAQVAIDTFIKAVVLGDSDAGIFADLRTALRLADDAVGHSYRGRGTTLTALWLLDRPCGAHIGDSRMWARSDGEWALKVQPQGGGRLVTACLGSGEVTLEHAAIGYCGHPEDDAWLLATDGLCPDDHGSSSRRGRGPVPPPKVPEVDLLAEALRVARDMDCTDNATGILVWKLAAAEDPAPQDEPDAGEEDAAPKGAAGRDGDPTGDRCPLCGKVVDYVPGNEGGFLAGQTLIHHGDEDLSCQAEGWILIDGKVVNPWEWRREQRAKAAQELTSWTGVTPSGTPAGGDDKPITASHAGWGLAVKAMEPALAKLEVQRAAAQDLTERQRRILPMLLAGQRDSRRAQAEELDEPRWADTGLPVEDDAPLLRVALAMERLEEEPRSSFLDEFGKKLERLEAGQRLPKKGREARTQERAVVAQEEAVPAVEEAPRAVEEGPVTVEEEPGAEAGAPPAQEEASTAPDEDEVAPKLHGFGTFFRLRADLMTALGWHDAEGATVIAALEEVRRLRALATAAGDSPRMPVSVDAVRKVLAEHGRIVEALAADPVYAGFVADDAVESLLRLVSTSGQALADFFEGMTGGRVSPRTDATKVLDAITRVLNGALGSDGRERSSDVLVTAANIGEVVEDIRGLRRQIADLRRQVNEAEKVEEPAPAVMRKTGGPASTEFRFTEVVCGSSASTETEAGKAKEPAPPAQEDAPTVGMLIGDSVAPGLYLGRFDGEWLGIVGLTRSGDGWQVAGVGLDGCPWGQTDNEPPFHPSPEAALDYMGFTLLGPLGPVHVVGQPVEQSPGQPAGQAAAQALEENAVLAEALSGAGHLSDMDVHAAIHCAFFDSVALQEIGDTLFSPQHGCPPRVDWARHLPPLVHRLATRQTDIVQIVAEAARQGVRVTIEPM